MKQKIVSNSSPIIFLAKLNALHLLNRYHVLIPASVWGEITRKETVDQDRIRKFLESDSVEKNDLEVVKSSTKLGNGEMSAICLANIENIKMILIDDQKAWINAEYHELIPKGTLWIITQAYRHKEITKKQAQELIMGLPLVNFYMSTELLTRALLELERI